MANQSYKYCEDTNYVDIHGRDVRVLLCEKTGRILIPIDELKEMGFRIYRKNQYDRLLIDDNQFTHEFNLYMLECAQSYMLKNKIVFKENEIFESINNCKKLLTEGLKDTKKEITSPRKFLQNHVIEQNCSDSNISITTNCTPSTPFLEQNMNVVNDYKGKIHSRHSSVSSSDNSRRSRNFGLEENENRKTYNNPNTSFDQRKSKNFNSQEDKNGLKNDRENGLRNEPANRRPPSNRSNFKQDNEPPREEQKKLFSVELNKQEQQVTVTHIEQDDVAWVQVTENPEVLLGIAEKIKEELQSENIVSRPVFNHVYLAEDEGEWYRCKPIKFKPLTVHFLDYGNSKQVTESDLREISEDLAQIPAQAVRVFFEDSQFKPTLYTSITIKVTGRRERGSYLVKILNSQKEAKEPRKEPVEPIEEVKSKIATFHNKPKPLGALQDEQRIMIIGEDSGKLVVRTKDSYEKLKKLEELMRELDTESLPSKPEKNQLVLVYKNGKPYRCQVLSVDNVSVELAALDYYEQMKVELSSVKKINKLLSEEPLTYIVTPLLKGYNGSENVKKYLQELVANNIKGTVVLHDREFDLKLGNDLLSGKLKSLDSSLGRIMLKDLQMYQPSIGKDVYVLASYKNSTNMTIVAQEAIRTHLDVVVKTDLNDDEPYIPIVGEVCLGEYQGSWSRCTIKRVMNSDRFEVQFIDFGNLEFLKSEQLRHLTEDAVQTPILGLTSKLVGLPSLQNIEQLLETHLAVEDTYQFDVKRFNGTSYEIEAPDIYNKILH